MGLWLHLWHFLPLPMTCTSCNVHCIVQKMIFALALTSSTIENNQTLQSILAADWCHWFVISPFLSSPIFLAVSPAVLSLFSLPCLFPSSCLCCVCCSCMQFPPNTQFTWIVQSQVDGNRTVYVTTDTSISLVFPKVGMYSISVRGSFDTISFSLNHVVTATGKLVQEAKYSPSLPPLHPPLWHLSHGCLLWSGGGLDPLATIGPFISWCGWSSI